MINGLRSAPARVPTGGACHAPGCAVGQVVGGSGEQVRYEPVGPCLRAPRFVVGYRHRDDWIYTARRVVESLSRVWGGAGAVVVPVDEAGLAEADLLRLVRSYDPDVIAAHPPIVEDLAHDDPGVVERL